MLAEMKLEFRSSGPRYLFTTKCGLPVFGLVWSVRHSLDNISVLETCYFINSFLLRLHSVQISPEQTKPGSDERTELQEGT